MNPVLRNVLAVATGIVVGSMISMVVMSLGMGLFPLPDTVNMNDTNSIAEAMKAGDFKFVNYLVPVVAHSIGTLVGAFLTAKISGHSHFILAMVIGGWFLVGGITMVYVLPSPIWLNIMDLTLAYIPMAWLGWKMAGAKR